MADNQPRTGDTKVRSHGNKQEQPGTALTAQHILTRQTQDIDTARLLEDIRNAAPKFKKLRRTDKGCGTARASDAQNIPKDQTAGKLFAPLAHIWEQMGTYVVYNDSGEPVARYPLTTQGKRRYVIDLFSEFLFQQIEQQIVLSLKQGDKTLLARLFEITETVWISNHAGGSGRKVETPPWHNYIIKENPDKLSYGLVESCLNGNNPLIKSTFTTAIQKLADQEISTIKELAGDDPEQMIQEAGQRYGLSREVNTDGQKKQFLDMFPELFAYARSHGIVAAHLQPKDCNLKLLAALITEDIDGMEKIRIVLIARATRVYNVTETQMKTMHEALVHTGHQGSYENYVKGRFDL